MDMEKLKLDPSNFNKAHYEAAARFTRTRKTHCSYPIGSELTETEIRAIDDRFLNGRKIGRTDAEKLRMIDEVLRRKRTLKTQAHIVRRWLGERGLLTPAEKLNTPLEKL